MKIIKLILIIFISGLAVNAQTVGHNELVGSSIEISTTVITPLSIDPKQSMDYLYWPTVPVGSKYFLNTNPNQIADFTSIFSINGEPGMPVEIMITRELEKDNVEISYSVKGTDLDYIGNPPPVPELIFNSGGLVVNLNSDGAYYIHLVYEWVWAKPGATLGKKRFTQMINVQYYGL